MRNNNSENKKPFIILYLLYDWNCAMLQFAIKQSVGGVDLLVGYTTIFTSGRSCLAKSERVIHKARLVKQIIREKQIINKPSRKYYYLIDVYNQIKLAASLRPAFHLIRLPARCIDEQKSFI